MQCWFLIYSVIYSVPVLLMYFRLLDEFSETSCLDHSDPWSRKGPLSCPEKEARHAEVRSNLPRSAHQPKQSESQGQGKDFLPVFFSLVFLLKSVLFATFCCAGKELTWEICPFSCRCHVWSPPKLPCPFAWMPSVRRTTLTLVRCSAAIWRIRPKNWKPLR